LTWCMGGPRAGRGRGLAIRPGSIPLPRRPLLLLVTIARPGQLTNVTMAQDRFSAYLTTARQFQRGFRQDRFSVRKTTPRGLPAGLVRQIQRNALCGSQSHFGPACWWGSLRPWKRHPWPSWWPPVACLPAFSVPPFFLADFWGGGAAAVGGGGGAKPRPWGVEVATGAERREDRGRAAPRDLRRA
jgi:hypothetical protein